MDESESYRRAVGLQNTVRAIGDSRPCRHSESCKRTLRDIGTVRVVGNAGTLGTVRAEEIL